MEIAVISCSHDEVNEIEEVVRMFDAGLKHFHIRKPRKNKQELSDYIQRFPHKFRKQLILHTYHGLASQFKLGGIHLSREHRKRNNLYALRLWVRRKLNPNLIVTRTFHKLTDITQDKRTYTYAFLSPVFDSVTRSSLAGGFSRRALHIIIPQAKQPIYALGGITVDRLTEVSENGFYGATFHGSIWDNDIPASQIFKEAKQLSRQLDSTRSEN